ncbi:hypothetical protein ACHAWF_001923 [Thalassiosira exigua]
MGSHKTGSSSIQELTRQMIGLLKSDGYEMPWKADKETNFRSDDEGIQLSGGQGRLDHNQVNFATCFLSPSEGEKRRYPCDADLLLHGLDIAARDRNLLVSAETFSNMDDEGVNMLATYLSRWDEVTIVVYYRRFYSWIGSVFNQIYKNRSLGDADRWDQPISSIMTELLDWKGYTVPLVERLRKRFENKSILVLNYHVESIRGLDESFFCRAVPNAARTCNAVRANSRSMRPLNERTSLVDCQDLAYGAKKAEWMRIDSDEEMAAVAGAVQRHVKKRVEAKGGNLKRLCPPPPILDRIWKKSLESEAALFPEGVDGTTTTSIDMMRSEFETAAKTTLCKVDVETTLRDGSWKTFFESYADTGGEEEDEDDDD